MKDLVSLLVVERLIGSSHSVLPGKLRMFLSVLGSAGVIMLYVKRIEHAVERGYALYKCNYYYY